jgi:nicotinamidase/pyrazinamidase
MKTVFFDVDTQLDFLCPAGALAVPGAVVIAPALRRLTRFAAGREIPIVSTADAHREDDPEFKDWKPHCIAGTAGQQKSETTLLSKPLVLNTAPGSFESLLPQLSGAAQIIVEKQMLDCFTNPNLRPLLAYLAADRYVVYGLVSELCVRIAAMGLLETGARVELVTDAIRHLRAEYGQAMLAKFQAAGGLLTTAEAASGGG